MEETAGGETAGIEAPGLLLLVSSSSILVEVKGAMISEEKPRCCKMVVSSSGAGSSCAEAVRTTALVVKLPLPSFGTAGSSSAASAKVTLSSLIADACFEMVATSPGDGDFFQESC